MYHTTYVDGRVSEEKVLEYIKQRRLTILEDDAIIVKNQPRALGIWVMKNGKIVESGTKSLARKIEESGYQSFE